MAAGLGHTSMANSLVSSLANSSSMVSGFPNSMTNTSMNSGLGNSNNLVTALGNSSSFGQKYAVDQMSWNSQFGLDRKSASELSPGSRKAAMIGGLPSTSMPSSLQPQGQQAFNIQLPKTTRKSGGFFGEEEDNETSMYFPSSSIFRPEKDMLNQSQSPSQPAGFGNNFYSQGGLNSFPLQQQQPPQRGPVSSAQFQRSNALTPTSLNPTFTPGGIPQNSPNRNLWGGPPGPWTPGQDFPLDPPGVLPPPGPPGPPSKDFRGVISAIGQHRMINNTQTSQAAMSGLQKRPIGSGLPNSTPAPISNLASSFGFTSRSDTSQPNFDLSDFPSLGNRVTPSSSMSAARNYVGMVSKNPVQDQTPEFQIQQEDFPALPGAQSTLSMFVSDPPVSGNSSDPTKKPIPHPLTKDGKFSTDKSSTTPQRKGIQVHPDGRVTNIPQGMVADQFGIVGLLAFIKSTESDHSLVALAPGMDLTTLGLNLNSPDNLYSTFQSPWVDLPCRPQDIDFHVPAEYLTNIYIREKLAPIKLNRYGEDLLFFLYYMNGGDVLQIAAAAELYNRDWRYHKEERVWITRAPGVEPVVKTNTYERGTYYFFDANNWRKVAKEFHLEYDKLEERPTLPPTLHHNPNQSTAAH